MSEERTKRILILTLSFGAGHVSAARALSAEFERTMPAAEIKIVDALRDCSLLFRVFYVWTYWAMIRFAPRLWDKFFAARVARRDEQTAPVWMWKIGCKSVFAEIKNFAPDLILACEVGASELGVIARRERLTTALIVNVITDFEAEPIWVKPEIAVYAAPNDRVARQLIAWNAPANKIKVCGIPLDASFAAAHDARETRRAFGLNEKPIVLLMGGGMGPTRMATVAEKLLASRQDLQILALPGKDRAARRGLEKLASGERAELKILDWTNKVAALMQAAQILATKPGGVTLAEAAAARLPLVLFDAIPGPEIVNARRFAVAGAAVLTAHPNETANAILELLNDRQRLGEMAKKSEMLAQPYATKQIARLASEILETSFAPKNAIAELENCTLTQTALAK